MIFATVAVGEYYIDQVCKNITRFEDQGYDIHILTDQPNKFDRYVTYEYPNILFSYTDKFLFSLMLARKFKTDVFFSDARRIGNIDNSFFSAAKQFSELTIKGVWEDDTPEWSEIKFKGKEWKPMRKFLIKENIDPLNCQAYIEHYLFIPRDTNLVGLQMSLEKIKPVLEYISTVNENRYTGIGSGEGVGLGYAIMKNNLKVDFFNPSYFI
jgi:hypothetical protein